MGSSGKKRTTAAKFNREGRLREKRVEKQARKAARKLSAAQDGGVAGERTEELGGSSAEFDEGRDGEADTGSVVVGLDAGDRRA